MVDWSVYSLVTLAGGCLSLLMGLVILWRNRRDLAARYLAMLELACAVWGILTSFEMASTELATSILWGNLSYIGIVETPVLLFCFVYTFVRHQRPFLWLRMTLHGFAMLSLLAVLTNSWHHLFLVSATIDPVTHLLTRTRGPLFPVFMAFAYGLFATCVGILGVGAMSVRGVYRSQRLMLASAALVPPALDVMSVVGWVGPAGMEWSPTAFAVSCALIAYSLRQQRLFDLRPVLRSRLLDVMEEAVLLLDEGGRIADFNVAMVRLIPAINESMGQPCAILLPRHPELCEALNRPDEIKRMLDLDVDGKGRVFDVRARPLTYSSGRARGHLVVLHDITAEHRLERERDGLLADLRDAVTRVQELGRLLPICANCKKIRDDQGFWHHVEAFIADHSEADLALALCPECLEAQSDQETLHTQAGVTPAVDASP